MNINESKLGSKMQSINKRLSIFEKGSKEQKGREREVMEYLQGEIEAVKGTTGGIGGMGGMGTRTPPMSDRNAPPGFLLHSPHRKGEGVKDAILMLLQEGVQVLAVNNTPPRPSTTRERTTPGSPVFHTPGVGVCPTSRGTKKNIPFNTLLTNQLDDLLIPKPKNFIFQCRNRGKTQLNIEDLLAGDLSNTPPKYIYIYYI